MQRSKGSLYAVMLVALPALTLWACDTSPGAGDSDRDAGAAGVDADVVIVPESCNQIDDNEDGKVDEGCTCTIDEVQACWPGDPSARNVGECKDGLQRCQGEVEFSQWGPCEGAVLPTEDTYGDGIDQNCDGGDGDACVPTGPEICNDDLDNDCDRDTDCRDSDCADYPLCGDCTPTGPEICGDEYDNDCDGLVDCDDTDDCYDDPAACTCIKKCPPGSIRWCDEPTYCRWGKQTCNPDGTWGTCTETPARPVGCESDEYYNPVCCVLAGQCCQSLPSNDSIGECPPGEIVCEDSY